MAKANNTSKSATTDKLELLEQETPILSAAVRWLFYAMFLLVPIYFNVNDVEAFEVPKGFLTYMLGFAILAVWGYKIFSQKQFIYRKTILDIPVLIFFVAQLIATLFSVIPAASLWGREDSHVGGLLFTFMLTALYFAFTHHFYNIKRIVTILQVMVFSAIVIIIYAFAQHFGIDFIQWSAGSGKTIRVHGTLGQANWMGIYFVMLAFFALVLELYRNFKNGTYILTKYSIFTYLYIFFCYLDLTYTVSRSGIIGFWIGLGLAAVAFVILGIRFKAIINLILIPVIVAVLAGIGTVAGVVENQFAASQFAKSAIERGENVRGFTWKAAVDTWKQNPKNILIGTGPETFDYDYNLIRPAIHNKYHVLNFTKVHNEVLHFLVTSGILGLGGYILILGILAFIVIKSFINTMKSGLNLEILIQLVMGASVVAFFVSNFFGFSATVTALGNNVIMALMAVAFGVSTKVYSLDLSQIARSGLKIASVTIFGLCSYFALQLHIADISFITAQRALDQTHNAKYVQMMQEALDLGSMGPFNHIYKREISRVYAIAATSYARAGRAQEATMFLNKAINMINTVTKENPKNQNVYRLAAATYMQLGQLDPKYTQKGLEMMFKAQELGPTFPDITYNISTIYLSLNDRENALKYVNKTLELQDNFANAFITKLGLLYDMGRISEANEELNNFMARNKPFGPQDNIDGLKTILAQAKQTGMLNKLNAYLAKQASAGAATK